MSAVLLYSLLSACRGDATPAPLVLNELVPSNNGSWEDADGGEPDWLELYNSGPTDVDLEGWSLAESQEDPWFFGSFTVPAGGYLVVAIDPESPDPALPFSLSAGGGELTLYDADGAPQDWTEWPALQQDQAWRRVTDGALPWRIGAPSPEEPNP